MSEPFIAQVQMWANTYSPRGWTGCFGQTLQISQNTALYSLIGTFYGGDGRTTMGVPNLKGRVPLGFGMGPGLINYQLGQRGGGENITLQSSQLPEHNHGKLRAAYELGEAAVADASTVLGVRQQAGQVKSAYASFDELTSSDMSDSAISTTGLGQAHENRQPYIALRFEMALIGVYPSRN